MIDDPLIDPRAVSAKLLLVIRDNGNIFSHMEQREWNHSIHVALEWKLKEVKPQQGSHRCAPYGKMAFN